MFLSNDKKCGVALKEVDIVSVFKHKDGPKGALDVLIPTAIANGGRRLDCFSIHNGLPFMYSKYGFIPVSKIKFDRKEAPDEWNYERDGEPDIVFMAYDKEAMIERNDADQASKIRKIVDNLPYSSYDDAVRTQKEFV